MKNLFFLLVIVFLFLTWCNHNIWHNKTSLETQNNEVFISPNGVKFKSRSPDFLNNKEKYEIPKDRDSFYKNYFYSSIKIQDTVITWCVIEGYDEENKWIKQYLDESIECKHDIERWGKRPKVYGYKVTIPWGIYNAYLPKDLKITHCSATNPIVCWNENIDENEVLEYYYKHNHCPPWFIYEDPLISWPTAYCIVKSRMCHYTTCDWIEKNGTKMRSCDLKKRLSCWFVGNGQKIAIWDPCDFYKWIWLLPTDWSCW